MVSRGIVVSKKEFSSAQKDDSDKNYVYVSDKARKSKKYKLAQELEQLNKNVSNERYIKYKVRVPLIHGNAGDASSIPDGQLPFCTFCPLPGSQYTELNVGDQVYVAVVDFKFDDLVILGCVPKQQIDKSSSGIALNRVQFLEMDENAPAIFSNKIQIGTGDNKLTYDNLASLKGVDYKLTEHVWDVTQGGTGVSLSSLNDEDAKKKVRDNFNIFSNKILSRSEFEDLSFYEKNTIYYIYEDEEKTSGTNTRGSSFRNYREVK